MTDTDLQPPQSDVQDDERDGYTMNSYREFAATGWGGRTRSVDMREVYNGIQYVLRTGCGWRHLPHDLPPWGTVHYYYRRFRLDGTWLVIHERLRDRVRHKAGRATEPSAAAAVDDAQSVKTTERGGYTGTTRARR